MDARDRERGLLTSPELKQFLDQQKIRIISYRELAESKP